MFHEVVGKLCDKYGKEYTKDLAKEVRFFGYDNGRVYAEKSIMLLKRFSSCT